MKRKTAWSNHSLLGCQICCLVDNLEWHEGIVRSFHRSSGKHLIDFESRSEARWMRMNLAAFYVVRPSAHDQETKALDDFDGALEGFDHVEDISLDFCAAQSRLYHVYGRRMQETGHKTSGHLCITAEDKDSASSTGGCLLYGELLPRGVNKALGPARLDAASSKTLVDLGMGTGKVCIQAFIQFPSLEHVFGVELARSRFCIARDAARSLCALYPDEYEELLCDSGRIVVERVGGGQVLEFVHGSMFDCAFVPRADIVLLETDVLAASHGETCEMLRRMRPEALLLTYLDLELMWDAESFPFVQHKDNKDLTDRYPTSWSVSRGHHFYIWTKVLEGHPFPFEVARNRVTTPFELNMVQNGAGCCLPILVWFSRMRPCGAPRRTDKRSWLGKARRGGGMSAEGTDAAAGAAGGAGGGPDGGGGAPAELPSSDARRGSVEPQAPGAVAQGSRLRGGGGGGGAFRRSVCGLHRPRSPACYSKTPRRIVPELLPRARARPRPPRAWTG